MTDRVIPPPVLRTPTPNRSDSIRGLVEIASRALAVASMPDLRDYWRLPAAEVSAAVVDLVDSGALQQVIVPGWRTAFLHRDAVLPRASVRRGLVSPFDSLIWSRPRTERLFDMRYRIEIYTRADRRQFGYYVLPYLHGGRLVARLDLKADRAAGALVVKGGWSQRELDGPAHPDPGSFAADLAEDLDELAAWLGLDGTVLADGAGDLLALLRRWRRDRRRPDAC